jgi:regulator of protease activity HflC (stomatin/prohibitin superfamily)
MDRGTQKTGLINALALIGAGAAGLGVARYSNSFAGLVSAVFIGLGALVAIVSWFQMRLAERERLEKMEFDELSRSRGGSALFETSDSEIFPAQRSREQFERFFVPVFAGLLCVLQGTAAYLLWRVMAQPASLTELHRPTVALALFAGFALVLFLLGKFSSAIARLENHRLLRPGAGYMLLGAYLYFAVTLGIVAVEASFPRGDFYVAHVLCGLLGFIALETLINLVLELYRPRVKGKIGRPLYESRLVGLLGQPEGLITTAAQALDYQFGFKVSDTWFYRFLERAFGWLLLMQLGLLFLSTSVVFIETGEQGLLERFGRPVGGRTVLDAGAHVKWPWPIDKVYRFPTEQVQSFEIGTSPDAAQEEGHVVIWTVAHSNIKEDNFLVANRVLGSAQETTTNAASVKRTPPVSLLTGTIPVQFQVTNLVAWAYNNEDATSLLHDLAYREIVRYFVGVDMNEVMSYGRAEASQELASRIQRAADLMRLGARVISVGLQDLHPPVKVAPDYEKVIAASVTKQAKILAARAYEVQTNALAGAQALTLTNVATSDRMRIEINAATRAALFTNQAPAFAAAPAVYKQRAYFETFARATANARKYILWTTNTHNVLTFDLQDKIAPEILTDLSVNPSKR